MLALFAITQEVCVNVLDGWKVVNQFQATVKIQLLVKMRNIGWGTVYEINSAEILQVWLVARAPVCSKKKIVEREIAMYLVIIQFVHFVRFIVPTIRAIIVPVKGRRHSQGVQIWRDGNKQRSQCLRDICSTYIACPMYSPLVSKRNA